MSLKFKKIKKKKLPPSCMICGAESDWVLTRGKEYVDIGMHKCDEYYCLFSLCDNCFKELKKLFESGDLSD